LNEEGRGGKVDAQVDAATPASGGELTLPRVALFGRVPSPHAFFDAVRGCPFAVRAIAVRKDQIYSPHLRTDKETFYEFFVKQMLRHDSGSLDATKVVIDGSGDRAFRRQLSTAIQKRVRVGTVNQCRFSDSKADPLIQLADMCAGAIARSYKADRSDATRWRAMLRPRIENVWDFK
jgi:hypothetical protein